MNSIVILHITRINQDDKIDKIIDNKCDDKEILLFFEDQEP